MSGEYRSNDEAARAKIEALEAELREREAKLSSLLFSRTPAKPFPAIRGPIVEPAPWTAAERPAMVALAVGAWALCWILGAGPIFGAVIGLVIVFALFLIGNALRALEMRSAPAARKRPEEVAALAALLEDREVRIESLNTQITNERAACDDLRKRIEEAEILLSEDDSVKNRESSR